MFMSMISSNIERRFTILKGKEMRFFFQEKKRKEKEKS